jgi:hypothetical protein
MTDIEARHVLALALHDYHPAVKDRVDAPHGVNTEDEQC